MFAKNLFIIWITKLYPTFHGGNLAAVLAEVAEMSAAGDGGSRKLGNLRSDQAQSLKKSAKLVFPSNGGSETVGNVLGVVQPPEGEHPPPPPDADADAGWHGGGVTPLPSLNPTKSPVTANPTKSPVTANPTKSPSKGPSMSPTKNCDVYGPWDNGTANALQGWYDVSGCGVCNDYCYNEHGGSLEVITCKLAGSYMSFAGYEAWMFNFTKCSGKGAAPPVLALIKDELLEIE